MDANSDQLDFDGDDAGDVCDADDDDDGVDDGGDLCQTSAPDSSVPVPCRSLKPNHYVWESGTTFTRGLSSGRGSSTVYTMTDTQGCTCAEIIDFCGYGEGLSKYGCSPGVMSVWVAGGGDTCE